MLAVALTVEETEAVGERLRVTVTDVVPVTEGVAVALAQNVVGADADTDRVGLDDKDADVHTVTEGVVVSVTGDDAELDGDNVDEIESVTEGDEVVE